MPFLPLLLQSVLTDPVTWLGGGLALTLFGAGAGWATLRTRVSALERAQRQDIKAIRADLQYLRGRVDDLADGRR